MRVVILRSNAVAPDPRVEKAAKALASSGYTVRIVAWDRTCTEKVKESLGYADVERVRIRSRFGGGVTNVLSLALWQMFLLAYLWRARFSYDILHACDFDTVLPASAMKVLFRKIVVYDVFDFYADTVRGIPEFLRKLIRAIDVWVMSFVDGVILVDNSRLLQISGAYPRRLEVVYNSPPDKCGTIPRSRTRHPEQSRFHIAYVGILQLDRGLLEMIDVVSEHPSWSLALAGFGAEEGLVLERSKALPNVRFLGRVDYDTALQIINESDVVFATYDPSIVNYRYSSPNKLFEAMMLAKPIIVSLGTGMDAIVEREQMGMVIDYGNKEALARVLEVLDGNAELRSRLGANARRAYEREYSHQISMKRLISMYTSLACA